jgi:hypothetical protein
MSTWFYMNGPERVGPVSQDQLCDLFRQGVLSLQTLVWSDAFKNWTEASKIAALRSLAPAADRFNDTGRHTGRIEHPVWRASDERASVGLRNAQRGGRSGRHRRMADPSDDRPDLHADRPSARRARRRWRSRT